MSIFRAFVAACLLLLSGCTRSDTTTPSLNPRQGKSTLDATGSMAGVIAIEPADSVDPNQNDPKLGEQNFRQANFGLNDPGVIVIRADQGGNINRYERK